MSNESETQKSEIVPLRPQLPSAPASEAAALISILERAALNPDMDVERVQRMYEMFERASARNARSAYDSALADMQPRLPVVEKRGRGHNDTQYALWEDIAEAVTKVTAQYGFSLTFRVKKVDATVEVTAILAHREGHREETTLALPIDASGHKNAVQAIGSSTSYGKRYTAGLLLNIITKGEDNDGGNPEHLQTVDDTQLQQLQSTITLVGASLEGFLRYMKVENLSQIKASDFNRAMTALKKKGRPNA